MTDRTTNHSEHTDGGEASGGERTGFVNLEHAPVGRPITRLGISFFPIYLPGNELPPIATGGEAAWEVDELDHAEVSALQVLNRKEIPILLLEGQQFVGGKQNRVINVNVLIPAAARLRIPVSCLEAGRWGRRRDFTHAKTFSPRQARRTVEESVARRVMAPGRSPRDRRSDQGAVWARVEERLDAMGVAAAAPTSAMAAAEAVFERDRRRGDAVEELSGLGPLPGQCGFVVTHGPRVVATEIFGAPELLRAHWSALIRSYLMEPPTARGRPSTDYVLRALSGITHAVCRVEPGLGLGEERHVRNRKGVGQALLLDGATVRATVLTR